MITQEIELKYRITNAAFAAELLAAPQLGDYAVTEFHDIPIADTYYDTADRAFTNAHLAVRHRRIPNKSMVQLKSQGSHENNLHRRTEDAVITDQPARPDAWPPGSARDLALATLGNRTLTPLFHIEQTRHKAHLLAEDQAIAQLCLDEVHWHVADQIVSAWELEIELLQGIDETYLEVISRYLGQQPHLLPIGLSKYERGLKLMAHESLL